MKKDECLREWVEHLMLYSANAMEPGLYVGKMGLCVCLAECARFFQDKIFVDLAGDLLEDVLETIDSSLPVNFSEGLCGIGWGIEYLLQQECLSGDSDIVLEDFDKQIMITDINRMTDFSIATGLAGIAYYVHARLVSHSRILCGKFPFDRAYLQGWTRLIPQICKSSVLVSNEMEIFRMLESVLVEELFVSKESIPFPRFILSENLNIHKPVDNFDLLPKGLCNGLAGMIVKAMRE